MRKGKRKEMNADFTMLETKEIFEKRMIAFYRKITEEKENLQIDGVAAYNEKAQFVAGKAINFCSYVMLSLLKDTDAFSDELKALRDTVAMLAPMKMETWGILNGLEGLYRLKEGGYYREVLSEETEEILRRSFDWRTFVDEEKDYQLIRKPTNYYGVAFGIARYRELLGWEPVKHSQILLDHLLKHIEAYSGDYGFMDETQGEGRFDRYSILIPSEITSLVLATEWEEPALIREMLKKSAEIVLSFANQEGSGFAYGRSIGAYGDTGALQVLAAAARLGNIFDGTQEKLAYGYSLRLIQSMVHFWYDEEMESINMWEKGRKTDQYRNKNRILGENLSLSMQIVEVLAHWQAIGYDGMPLTEDWTKLLPAGRDLRFYRFAKEQYDRGLVIYRDGSHIWQLPLISGGKDYFDRDAYQPVPRQNFVSEGIPEERDCALLPCVILEDGTELRPSVYITEIQTETDGEDYVVRYRTDGLCQVRGAAPEKRTGTYSETEYRLSHGKITREDRLYLGALGNRVKEISLVYWSFAEQYARSEEGKKISFAEGRVTAFSTAGYDMMDVYPVQEDGKYVTPHGGLYTRAAARRTGACGEEIRLSWCLEYRQ